MSSWNYTNGIKLSDTSGYSLLSEGGVALLGNKKIPNTTVASTTAGSLAIQGDISLTDTLIFFDTTGDSPPSFGTRSAGTKLVLYPALTGSTLDYAIGITTDALWCSSPGNFRWYNDTTPSMTLSSTLLDVNVPIDTPGGTFGNVYVTGGNVGVNNTSPGYALDVSGTTRADRLVVPRGAGIEWDSAGVVSSIYDDTNLHIRTDDILYFDIGTTAKLQVTPDAVSFSAPIDAPGGALGSLNVLRDPLGGIIWDSEVSGVSRIYDDTNLRIFTDDTVYFNIGNTLGNEMILTSTLLEVNVPIDTPGGTFGNVYVTGGNVGINNTSPGYALDVSGTTRADRFVVPRGAGIEWDAGGVVSSIYDDQDLHIFTDDFLYFDIGTSGSSNILFSDAGINLSNTRMLNWDTNGAQDPTFGTRSPGTKIVLFPKVDGSNLDHAIGVGSDTLWMSVSGAFEWFNGSTTPSMVLTGENLQVSAVTINEGVLSYEDTLDLFSPDSISFSIGTSGNPLAVSSTGASIFGGMLGWDSVGVSPPTFSTRSAGTKLVLYPALTGSTLDCAIGVNTDALWCSSPGNFRWYNDTTPSMVLSSVLLDVNVPIDTPGGTFGNVYVTGGNVGINNTSPGYALDVSGTTRANRFVVPRGAGIEWDAGGVVSSIYDDSNLHIFTDDFLYFDIGTSGSSNILFSDAGINLSDTRTLNWDTTGYGDPTFGTRSQGTKIVLFPKVDGSNLDHAIGVGSGTLWMSISGDFEWFNSSTAPSMILTGPELQVFGDIRATGDIVSFDTVSDERLKENVQGITGGLDIVNRLSPVTFNWKPDIFYEKRRGKSDSGFIAQEINKVIPHTSKTLEVDETCYSGIDYNKVIPYLVSAIQELGAKLNRLENST